MATLTKNSQIIADLKKALKNNLLAVVTLQVQKEGKKESLAIVNDLVEKEKVTKALRPFAKKISILPLSGLWQAIYDGKLSLLTTIITGKILYDNGFVKAMKAAETLKLAVIKKFERYIMSVILMGSVAQGKATPESDIDLAIIVDDTDLKNMSRDEAIILGIKALSQGNGGKVNPEAIEIGLVEKGVKFHKLPPEKTLEYVKKALGGK